MALTNAEKQQRFRARNVVVLSDDVEAIAAKLVRLERRKLRTLVARINSHLKATRGMKADGAVNDARLRENERLWRQRWLKEHPGRTAADYSAGLKDHDGEIWQWRRATGQAAVAAERAAWLRDHPGNPLPEHLCTLSDAEGAAYDAWQEKYVLRPRSRKAGSKREKATAPNPFAGLYHIQQSEAAALGIDAELLNTGAGRTGSQCGALVYGWHLDPKNPKLRDLIRRHKALTRELKATRLEREMGKVEGTSAYFEARRRYEAARARIAPAHGFRPPLSSLR
jgi:hypothetical protein